MSRTVVALFLIIILCLSAIAANSLTAYRAQALAQAAQVCAQHPEQTSALVDEWEKSRNVFSLFVSHSKLDPIAEKINSLDFISDRARAETAAEIHALAIELSESLSLSFYNLF